MDSQENALLQGTMEEPAKKAYATKQEVLERVKEIARSAEAPNKEELDHLKTTFYKIHLAERDAQTKEYLEKGGDPEKFVLLPDDTEEAFKAEMQIIKEKRAKIFLEQEEEKQENLAKKLEIIEKIKAMATSPEEANQSYNDFKALQQEWKEIKTVPADKANELWRNYQLYVEQFYVASDDGETPENPPEDTQKESEKAFYHYLTITVTTQVGLSYSPMHNFPRCNQRE